MKKDRTSCFSSTIFSVSPKLVQKYQRFLVVFLLLLVINRLLQQTLAHCRKELPQPPKVLLRPCSVFMYLQTILLTLLLRLPSPTWTERLFSPDRLQSSVFILQLIHWIPPHVFLILTSSVRSIISQLGVFRSHCRNIKSCRISSPFLVWTNSQKRIS